MGVQLSLFAVTCRGITSILSPRGNSAFVPLELLAYPTDDIFEALARLKFTRKFPTASAASRCDTRQHHVEVIEVEVAFHELPFPPLPLCPVVADLRHKE